MQPVSANFAEALSGSFTPVTVVDAWYDGDLVLANVPVTAGTVTADSSRAITSALSVSAAADGDLLLPTSWDSPLAPYGSELQVRAGVSYPGGATELVSLGWFRIDSTDPSEWWAPYTLADGSTEWACRGTQVACEASDRMAVLDDARMLAPTQPASTASVVNEITRLAAGLVPVGDMSNVTDAAIPGTVTYQESRLQAITDLAAVLGATPRMDANGSLVLVTDPTGAPAWTVTVGVNGTITSWGRKLTRTDLYNGVVSTGDSGMTVPVVGSALETTGPLRWGGPFGQVPYGHSSPLITTQAAANNDASTTLKRLVSQRVAEITLSCTANPALELGDLVAVALPDKTLTGAVTAISWALPLASMSVTVQVPRDQLWSV